MATSFAPLSISGGWIRKNDSTAIAFRLGRSRLKAGGSHLKAGELGPRKGDLFGKSSSRLILQRKCNKVAANNKLSVRAAYGENRGGDFAAGFIIGGAIFGTLAYVFAPQIRRSILNEDEHGFRKARRPIYYDEGLESTRETLNAKISQLNNAIDKVSSRLRGGGNNTATSVPLETDPEEAVA